MYANKNIIITIVLIGMIVTGTVLTVKRQQSVDTQSTRFLQMNQFYQTQTPSQ